MDSSILKARTKKFAIDTAKLCAELRPTYAILAYTKQLVRCSSSVGANYRAACRAKSTADFINKLKIVEEEVDESVYFLELIIELEPTQEGRINPLIKEGNEILAIIVASINTAKRKAKSKI